MNALLHVAAAVALAQITPATDAPQPSSPERSLELFRLEDGFRIELIASEPLIAEPSGITWDEDGRLLVSELHGYNLEGHLDVQELNRSGVLDRAVRRIPAAPEARRAAERDTFGRVKLLEDTDGDGRMDRASLWADRLPPCYGLLAVRGGVVVACAPDIVFLADRDGDGEAEVRETLFTGFGRGALERGINTPRPGLDNWIWFGRGHGGEITGARLDAPVPIGNTDFRIRGDGTAIEPVTGGTGTFGITFTDFGDRFLITGGNHAYFATPLPHRALLRNPFVPSPGADANASTHDRIFPISAPHPWRLQRSQDPAWVRFYGSREATASGYFTSACGPVIYRADAFPPEYHGSHFSCEPQNNLVHRCIPERDGAGYRLRRPAGDEEREFLASSEKWFRPTGLFVGPDGALWIVDMYREIIEDYSAIPRFLQQQYGLVRGMDRGRIWRVVHESTPAIESPRLGAATIAELVEHTGHPNAWWRETAQRLLVERGDPAAAPLLSERVRTGRTPQSRLHALATLDGLGALGAGDIRAGLDDASWGVRRHALRLAGEWLDRDGAVLDRVIELAADGDASVRLQAALTLGDSRDERAIAALAEIATRRGDERWVAAAVASSAATTAPALIERIVAAGHDRARLAGEVLDLLSQTVGARGEHREIARLLGALAARGLDATIQERCLGGLETGLRRGAPGGFDDASGLRALTILLESPDGAVRDRAFAVVGALSLDGAPFLERAFARAASAAIDETLDLAERLASLRLLANAPFDVKRSACEGLLEPRQPDSLQLGAVAALASSDDAGVGPALLARWRRYTPALRAAVLDAVFARSSRLPALLDAFDSGEVEVAALSALQRSRLTENESEEIRRRAVGVLGDARGTRPGPDVYERFAAALERSRSPERGAALFEQHCLPCHRVGDRGHEVGPDLASERERADETLLDDILAPSTQITAGYSAYVVTTRDGRAVSGVLANESATSVTLRAERGVEETILRRSIRTFTVSPVSLMPDNLATLLSPADVADIIAYLRSTFGEVLPGSVTLFDDEAEFVSSLTDGGGVAALVREDVFSGSAALTVTPPQRYAARIPGWSFRIAERPVPGEYRFLRLAWKTTGGDGVMVEIAADGRWPPARSPKRRYYSGKNTTEWEARRVSERAPAEWTVITVDLWRDSGDFTLTGIAPTAMGGVARFDRIELLRRIE